MSGSDPVAVLKGKRLLFIGHDAIGSTGTASKYYYPLTAASLGAEVGVIGDWRGEAPSLSNGVHVFDVSIEGGARRRAKEVRRIVEAFRPDIVHVYFHRGFGWYRYLCRDLNARWVVDVRGPLLSSGVRRQVSRLLNRIERTGYDAVAGHSVGSVATVFGDEVSRSASVTRIGVEVERFRMTMAPQDSQFRMVYIGGIDRRRQLETMVRAFASASKRMPMTLDLIGDGDGVDALKDLAHREGVTGLRFLGSCRHAEVPEKLCRYHGAVSFIGPRVYDSGPPLKTLEYFASGLPVVASDTAGNRMLMEDGVEGIYDKEGTVESLSDAMVALSQTDVQALSSNARQRAETFSWQRVVSNDLPELYARLYS